MILVFLWCGHILKPTVRSFINRIRGQKTLPTISPRHTTGRSHYHGLFVVLFGKVLKRVWPWHVAKSFGRPWRGEIGSESQTDINNFIFILLCSILFHFVPFLFNLFYSISFFRTLTYNEPFLSTFFSLFFIPQP